MKTSTLVRFLKALCYPIKFISNLFIKMQFVIYGSIALFLSFKVAQIGSGLNDTQIGMEMWCGMVSFILLVGGVVMLITNFMLLYDKQRRNNY